MTSMPAYQGFNAAAEMQQNASDHIKVDETYWGYIIRSDAPDPTFLVIGQTLAWITGAGFAIAALGLWVVPAMAFTGDLFSIRIGASSVMGGIAALLLWFAGRGARSELHVDTSLGEVREVIRNRSGRTSLIGRYGFDSIASVFLDRSVGDQGDAALVLRYRDTGQVLPVARGRVPHLEGLRDRMGRDFMTAPMTRRRPMLDAPKALRMAG